MPRKPLFLLAFLILLTACKVEELPKTSMTATLHAPQKTFPVRGKVIATDATHVTLDHEAVPGFMDAMTMPYKLKDPSVISELHPGDLITARILATTDGTEFHDV
ncbi:MAG TPA: copper-binding protein, partial [Edaphobacter sp.]